MIVSVSRRCDIPRFNFDWFRERLDAGFAETVNPFNNKQVRRVSLLPEETEALIFWTRDPRPILDYAKTLAARSYRYYVMTTLTGYPALLEPNMPPPEAVIAAMGELAEKIGPQRVIWRYDPLFLSDITGPAFHLDNFAALAKALRGTVRRVIISVYDEYGGAQRRIAAMERAGTLKMIPHYDDSAALCPAVRDLLSPMARIAKAAGMDIHSCAEAENLEPLGIKPGACIDGALIKELWGIETGGRDKNQRPHCGCAPSVDIGAYGACPAGCVYCYARR